MYFETDQVNDALLCIKCEGRLDIPKISPCGESICSFCETSIQVNDRKCLSALYVTINMRCQRKDYQIIN